MTRVILVGLVSFLMLTSWSCKTKQTVLDGKNSTTGNDKQVLLSISKGACMGKCPQYNFTLYRDGKADYEGIAHVEKMDKLTMVYPKSELDEIINHLSELQVGSLKDDYGIAPDFPETTIRYFVNGQVRTTVSTANVPRELKMVHEYFEEVMNQALKNQGTYQVKPAQP